MKKIKLIVFFAVAAGLLISGGLAGLAVAASQTKCPVMGYNVDQKVFADHQGKRVYFCCKDCPEKFKADPDKYMKKMETEGITPAAAPK